MRIRKTSSCSVSTTSTTRAWARRPRHAVWTSNEWLKALESATRTRCARWTSSRQPRRQRSRTKDLHSSGQKWSASERASRAPGIPMVKRCGQHISTLCTAIRTLPVSKIREAYVGYRGLREFLDVLEREGELAYVHVPVDLDQELGAVCVKSLRLG